MKSWKEKRFGTAADALTALVCIAGVLGVVGFVLVMAGVALAK